MPLDREQIVAGALRLVDGEGLDALTLRSLAAHLGVQAPTLYWHVKNKSELLDALADAIMDDAIGGVEQLDADTTDPAWLLEALEQLRGAMLHRRDGARIVSGARSSLRRADFSERAMATLVERGMDVHRARLLVLAGERYTVGWVLEEQSPEPVGAQVDPDELQARFPVMMGAISDYFVGTGRTADDLYRDAARLILHIA
ncbi:TetR family transcriptional regulator [Microbacterium sp. NPDC019599]|uniref:TetR family transcriptional regulator n=1 Tax=Microbacterium sp. NPDC019599 TaxID=3154690 RepID=UPI0033DBBAE4